MAQSAVDKMSTRENITPRKKGDRQNLNCAYQAPVAPGYTSAKDTSPGPFFWLPVQIEPPIWSCPYLPPLQICLWFSI